MLLQLLLVVHFKIKLIRFTTFITLTVIWYIGTRTVNNDFGE